MEAREDKQGHTRKSNNTALRSEDIEHFETRTKNVEAD